MKKVLVSLFLLIGLHTLTFAQSPQTSPTPPKKDEDVFKITTNLIQLDVTVLDKDGNIVTDLTPNDFEILENDKPQKITNLSFINLDQSKSETVVADAAGKPDKNAIPPPPVPTKLNPNEVRRTIALVVDDLGLSFGNVLFVRQALKKFVDEQMQPGDLVAIIRTGSGIGALQQFTSDKRMLYAAIDRIKFNLNGRVGVSSFDPIQATMKEQISGISRRPDPEEEEGAGGEKVLEGLQQEAASIQSFNSYREDTFAVGTLGAMNYIVRGMGELPGRKAAMLFSEGFSMYEVSASGQLRTSNSRLYDVMRKLTDSANRSGVIIYAMDPRGLVAPGFTAEDDVGNNLSTVSPVLNESAAKQIAQREAKLFDTQASLQYLARETGGFAIINQNNISKGIQRVLNDQKGYYLLGYEPDDETFDPRKNRFNKLTVRVKRPGLKVRYRSGFFARDARETENFFVTAHQDILNALTSPFTRNDINLKIHSIFTGEDRKNSLMRTFVHINGGSLKFVEDKDGWGKTSFEILATTFGDNGAVIDMHNRVETIKARSEALEEIRQKGLVYSVVVPVKKPGAYQMRFVLRDSETGKLGSASQYIEIPSLKKKQLAISGIALQRRSASLADENQLQNQLQTDERRDIALRRFKSGMELQFAFALYNVKSGQPLTTQFKIFRNGKEVFIGNERNLTGNAESELQVLNAGGTFTLGGQMPPGDYVLQVIVRDSPGSVKNAAVQWIDFEIVK